MKNTILSILSIAIFIGGFFFLYFSGPVKQETPVINPLRQNDSEAIQENPQISLKQNLEPKTDNQSAVTVIVTPTDISSQSKEWRFDVVMDTHSVELDQDMTKSALLTSSQGKEYKPIRWEGSEAGGHHREGVLIFTSIVPYPQNLKLIIKDIAGVSRSFLWILVE